MRNVTDAIRSSKPAIAAYILGGLPTPQRFAEVLVRVSRVADVVEVGIPFSDPMADGLTLQEANIAALAAGATPLGILETIRRVRGDLSAPVVLMSYLNPLLSVPDLPARLAAAGIEGCIVPDLPLEESALLGVPTVQLVAPNTSARRAARLAGASSGFVYAVTACGTTGGAVGITTETVQHLHRVRGLAGSTPVLAGFGIRSATQVAALAPHCDGVVVGSALVRTLLDGGDPAATIRGLRPERSAA